MTESVNGESKQPAQIAVSAESVIASPGEIDSLNDSRRSRSRSRPLRILFDLLHDFAIAMVVCLFLITYVVQAFKVQGSSMAPLLRNGERILVNKFIYHFHPIERGDVVVFWYPEDPEVSFIKRVVALPGDRVEIRRGKVYVNRKALTEPYVLPDRADRRSHSATEVRPGHYFVLGDNRQGSNDSRSWGLVPHRYIYGKAFWRVWPVSELGSIR